MLEERAPAKINLTLTVRGRRPDGYHELASLVAFADVGDTLMLMPDDGFALKVDGPFASALSGENLVERAAQAFTAACPSARLGAFTLTKRLPVSSGIGGGSADAAATLRLLARANADNVRSPELAAIARGLGADVPVCLHARAAFMTGAGESVAEAPPLPPVWAVLVNPGVAVATAEVFRVLSAAPVPPDATSPAPPDAFADWREIAGYVTANGNDLAAPATAIAPVIADVLDALDGTQGCLAAAMSGSGATCFGLYETEAGANAGRETLYAANPGWWVAATPLG